MAINRLTTNGKIGDSFNGSEGSKNYSKSSRSAEKGRGMRAYAKRAVWGQKSLSLRLCDRGKPAENPIEAMKQRITDELQALERITRGLQTFLSQAPEQPSELEIRGVASYLQDFYNGAERIFERIAVTLDGISSCCSRW